MISMENESSPVWFPIQASDRARDGKKRIVWRYVSRLEFGTKYCHVSPTLDEGKLHHAILDAMNEYAAIRQEVAPMCWRWWRKPSRR